MRDDWGRKIPKKKSAVQIVAEAFHGKHYCQECEKELTEKESTDVLCNECRMRNYIEHQQTFESRFKR